MHIIQLVSCIRDGMCNVFMLIMTTHSIKQSNSALMTFFLMMVINQGAQEKAQAEIDAVVGGGRLPTMDDRPLLPYLDAIFRETFRYSPVVPLCESDFGPCSALAAHPHPSFSGPPCYCRRRHV